MAAKNHVYINLTDKGHSSLQQLAGGDYKLMACLTRQAVKLSMKQDFALKSLFVPVGIIEIFGETL